MQKIKIAIFFLGAFFLLFVFSLETQAATYYVCDTISACNAQSSGWNTGNDNNICDSKSSPCKTIKAGVGKLIAGDTLIIGDGLYTGYGNMLCTEGWSYDINSGAEENYITIKGENYLGAILDGQNSYWPIHLENESYVIFENLYLRNPDIMKGGGGSNVFASYSDHLKFINMAAENGHGKFWFRRCNHILVDGCIAWGKGTYFYFFGGDYGNYTASQYNIVRRSVARRDCHRGSIGGNHYSAFVSYWGDHTYFQNNISLDANRADCGDLTVPIYTMSVFYTANGSSSYSGVGNISVNDEGQIGQFESNASPVTLRNNAVWMNGVSNTGLYTYGPTVIADNNTFGNVGGMGEYQGECVRTNGNPIFRLKNNILVNCEKGGLVNVHSNNSYNILYNKNNYLYSTPGIGERADVNPQENGWFYLPRVEPGSMLATACEASGRCGANIMKAVGQPGALYGESGWDIQTDINLWPWKHENKIKDVMGDYTGSYIDNGSQFVSVNGARGFAAPGNGLYGGPITLTSYIWEYLGNPCPAGICSSGGDIIAPGMPGGLTAR